MGKEVSKYKNFIGKVVSLMVLKVLFGGNVLIWMLKG